MARIFSIAFNFKNENFTALVTTGTVSNGDNQFTVSPVDDALKDLLPAGKLSFRNLNDLDRLADSQPQLHELASSIASALHQKI